MKVKFGELTARQLADICNSHDDCEGCPFVKDTETTECRVALSSTKAYIDFEIDLPDEEVKENAEIY